VVALDPEQRPDARQQLVAVEALRDEFVRPGFDRLRFSGPSLAVSMITGSMAVSSRSRSCRQTQ